MNEVNWRCDRLHRDRTPACIESPAIPIKEYCIAPSVMRDVTPKLRLKLNFPRHDGSASILDAPQKGQSALRDLHVVRFRTVRVYGIRGAKQHDTDRRHERVGNEPRMRDEFHKLIPRAPQSIVNL